MTATGSNTHIRSSSAWRWPVLLLSSLVLTGSYYCLDIPAALKQQIDTYFNYPSHYETLFSMLYSLYATPNVILPFFGGYFVDRYGVSKCLIVFSALLFIGQTVVVIGLYMQSWPIIFLGRFIFGLGGENLSVTTSVQVSEWFLGGELAFAFGINLSVAKLASVANDFLSPVVATYFAGIHTILPAAHSSNPHAHSTTDDGNNTNGASDLGVVFAAAFGALLCLLSFLSVFIYIRIEDHVDNGAQGDTIPASSSTASLTTTTDYRRVLDESTHLEAAVKELGTKVVYGTSGSRGHVDHGGDEDINILRQQEEPVVPEHSEMVEVFTFPLILWLLFLSCFVVYGCTLPFNNISASLLLERNFFVAPPDGCALKNPNMCETGSNKPNNLCPASQWFQPPLPAGTPEHPLVTACGNYTRQLYMEDIDCTSSCWSNTYTPGHSPNSPVSLNTNESPHEPQPCAHQFCHALTNSEAQAAMIMSIPYALSAILIPLMGLLVDKFGGRALCVSVSALILVCVHATLGYTHVGPIAPLIGQGVAYALFVTVFWPAVPMVIDVRLNGLAFGVAVSVQNGGCALMPVLASIIYTNSGDKYIPHVEDLFIGLGAIGFVLSLWINYRDYMYHNNVLNKPSAELEIEELQRSSSHSSLHSSHTHTPSHSQSHTPLTGTTPTRAERKHLQHNINISPREYLEQEDDEDVGIQLTSTQT